MLMLVQGLSGNPRKGKPRVRISQTLPPLPPISPLPTPIHSPAFLILLILILLLLVQEGSSAAQIVGKGRQGQARHSGRSSPTPHFAHALFAELGLAPRPEGKESSRLKASRNLGRNPRETV